MLLNNDELKYIRLSHISILVKEWDSMAQEANDTILSLHYPFKTTE